MHMTITLVIAYRKELMFTDVNVAVCSAGHMVWRVKLLLGSSPGTPDIHAGDLDEVLVSP